MAPLRVSRVRRLAPAALVVVGAWLVAAPAPPASQTPGAGTYTLYSSEGRRPLTVRAVGSRDVLVFALNQLSGLFGLKFQEDISTGGLVIETKGSRIVSVPGQSFVQVSGKIISLDGPIDQDRGAWQVPLDFLPKVLGPAVGQAVVIRASSRIILVGDVRVPQVSGRVEKTATGGRVVIDVQPPAPRRVVREGNRVFVRFDAVALDATPIQGSVPNFISGVRLEGTAVVIGLGTSAFIIRNDDERDLTKVTIELLPAPPPPPVPPLAPMPALGGLPGRGVDPGAAQVPARPPAPAMDLTPGAIRTIVIDPGHGGADAGATGASGAKEKDIALDVAKRLKMAIESRLGIKVFLTREGDEDVAIDQRITLANHNKADLFVSLHANASVRASMRGAQVISLNLDDYPDVPAELKKLVSPLIGGGTRAIAAIPWDLAQVPFATRSAAFASVLAGRLNERTVPLHPKATDLAPMRVLASVNMPAVLIELGFLTNAEDETALASGTLGSSVIEAILLSIADVKRGIPDPDVERGGR
jgi:N-acetylmuramoyl-L-alanine amidase